MMSVLLSYVELAEELWTPHESISKKDLVRAPTLGGEGKGNPLQYSCLGNPMDGGAWWPKVHRAAKSQTQLSDFTSLGWGGVSVSDEVGPVTTEEVSGHINSDGMTAIMNLSPVEPLVLFTKWTLLPLGYCQGLCGNTTTQSFFNNESKLLEKDV